MNDKKPLVSIFTLTYNHALYIRQCLDGFIMQKTSFSFEVIVNDDASTDGTTDIIREYESKYPEIIKPVYHDENLYSKGEYGFWKRYCLPRARGKYIALCEGDDYWIDPLKLQKQVDFLEVNREYSMCCTDYYRYIQNTGRLLPYSLTDKHVITTKDLMKYNMVATLTTLIRVEYLKEYSDVVVPRMPRFPMGDYPMWIWLSTKSPIYRMEERPAVYRVLDESASHSRDIYIKFRFMVGGYNIKIYFNKLLKLGYRFLYLKKTKAVLTFCIRNKKYRLLFENIF